MKPFIPHLMELCTKITRVYDAGYFNTLMTGIEYKNLLIQLSP